MKKIIVIAGLNAVGKDTILNSIDKELCKPNISYTTRPIRDNEVKDVDYHYITEEEFVNKINNGSIIEYRKYNVGTDENPEYWYYGTGDDFLRSDVPTSLVLDIDGLNFMKNKYKNDVIGIIITLEEEIRYERAKARCDFNPIEYKRRKKDDDSKYNIPKLRKEGVYYFVENLNKETTVKEVEEIIMKCIFTSI